MKLSLLLCLCGSIASCLGQNTETLKVYQLTHQGMTVYQYTLGSYGAAGELVNGETKEPGSFTFAKLLMNEYTQTTNRNLPTDKKDNFKKKWHICRCTFGSGNMDHIVGQECDALYNIFLTNDIYKTVTLTNVRHVGTFYASQKPLARSGSKQLYISHCKVGNQFIYTRLTDDNRSCPSGAQLVNGADIYIRSSDYPGRIACRSLSNTVSNGRVDGQDWVNSVFPTKAVLSCDRGYQPNGTTEVFCHNGTWSADIGECQRITCAVPSIQNGKIKNRKTQYKFGDKVEYECYETFEFESQYNTEQTCEADGSWVPYFTPSCKIKRCPYPGEIMYGSLHVPDDSIGGVATYNCATGYKLEGNPNITCQMDKTWSTPRPFCTRITCPSLSQPDRGFFNANDFYSGSVVEYKCHEGSKMVGADLLRCVLSSDGQSAEWDNQPPICQAIVCARPVVNSNVRLMGSDFRYGMSVTFECKDGYDINGASIAKCTENGWDISPPSCSARMCRDPGVPEHGTRTGDSFNVYATVTFNCEVGYQLNPPDANTLFCETNTRWNKPTPCCDPIHCPKLPHPVNGFMSNELFQYGQDITFQCFPGYQLQGNPTVACQSNGQWNGEMPQCYACPRNQYKSGMNQDLCKQCPARSLTLSEATTSIDHCMCEEGSSKQDDGSCKAIRCANLTAPENGKMVDCEPSSGSICYFFCDPGYILSGSRDRRCTQNGWTGTQPVCTACPANTYKPTEESQTCLPCPINTHTKGLPGTSLQSCECKPGYTAGSYGVGVCYDVNECNDDNGGCRQACSNTEGSYYCHCTIPGYTLLQDGKTCVMSQSCTPLTQAPQHGNISCVYNPAENGQICYFTCKPGYFFVSGVNDYVTCGPDTGFKWSHQRVNETAQLPGCTKEFFVDTQLPVSFNYTSHDRCEALGEFQTELRSSISAAVKELQVCSSGTCTVNDTVITCENLGNGGSKVHVRMEVFMENIAEEIGTSCDPTCIRLNLREMLGKTVKLRDQLKALTEEGTTLSSQSGLSLGIDKKSFKFHTPKLLCMEEGRVLTNRRLCVPCDAGYYLPRRDLERCLPCPVGQFQKEQGKTTCDRCLEGASTAQEGSNHPAMCNVIVTQIIGSPSRKRRSLDVDLPLTKEEIEEILSILD